MRIVFMGTPEFSVPTLKRIVSDGHVVVAVYTRAPKPGGRRGLDLVKTPVYQAAESAGIPIFTPDVLKGAEAAEILRSHAADVAIVIAYGLLLPKAILDAPPYGCLNLHASLLPRWRGAAPIQRAIMAGDAQTGVDLMRIEKGLDTGPVALRRILPILPADTAGDIEGRLADLAADVASEGLTALQAGTLTFQDQQGEANYAAKILKSETDIDWGRSAPQVRAQIHGLSPAPGAFSTLSLNGRNERIKIYRVEIAPGEGRPGEVLSDDMKIACGEGSLRVIEGQRAGRKVVQGRELMGGESLAGACFKPSDAT